MDQLVGAHSLWWDAMLGLDAERRDLVLPQLKSAPTMSDFVDFSGEPLPTGRNGWNYGWGDQRKDVEENCGWNIK